MLFNSLQFLLFFPLVVAGYFAIKPKYRWILLLGASYYFYMCWNYKYIILIAYSTFTDYVVGILMHKARNKRIRFLYLLLSLGTNLGMLFYFKYFNFLGESLNSVFDKFNMLVHIPTMKYLLPVGISFYTFQALSYTIDVYKGNKAPEYHFGRFAQYVSFFPQMVAGPIERSSHLLPQFYKTNKFEYERVKSGILLMCWGFFKKVVIADRLGEYVNEVYNHTDLYHGLPLILATVFFAFQIYCDFSGYSDIAIGTARVLGYDLMINFRRPYLATSIQEFWHRWHISLSTWFRDYVYIPLGGNRVRPWRWHVNLFLTFLISGFWHGAEWTFVIWGGLHGFYLVFANITKSLKDDVNKKLGLQSNPKIFRLLQIFSTLFLVILGWIFFRANSFSEAILVIKNLTVFGWNGPINLYRIPSDFYIAIISLVFLMSIEILEEDYGLYARLQKLSRPVKWIILALIILCVMLLGVWDEADFLYFQF